MMYYGILPSHHANFATLKLFQVIAALGQAYIQSLNPFVKEVGAGACRLKSTPITGDVNVNGHRAFLKSPAKINFLGAGALMCVSLEGYGLSQIGLYHDVQ